MENELIKAIEDLDDYETGDWAYGFNSCKNQVLELVRNTRLSNKWIPVSERLPEDGIDVLVYSEAEDMIIDIAWYNKIIAKWIGAAQVTHWMPLPSPPIE